MPARNFGIRALLALAGVATVSVIAFVVSLGLLATSIDSHERKREHAVVEAEFLQVVHDVRDRVGSDANWDSAVLHIDNQFDPVWVQQNFTSQFPNDVTNNFVMVLDANDRVVFAREHAQPVQAARVADARRAADGLIRQMRTAEVAHARAATTTERKTAADWVLGSAVLLNQDRPALVAASLVGPDAGAVRQRHLHAPIVMYWSDVQTAVVPALAGRLLLQDAVVTNGGRSGGRNSIALTDAAGRTVATLGWTAQRPGRSLLVGALLPLCVVVSALAAGILVACRQGIAGGRALQISEAQAHHLALHDGLTGLANRRLFNDRIMQALSHTKRHGGGLSVLLLDLDRFKLINDTYGHPAGDELIQEVSRRLLSVCRADDTCARLGGDEFVILAMLTEAADAAAYAERLVQALAEPVQLSTALVHTAASIGISVCHDGNGTAADLLRQADLALYKAKERARGGFRFFELEMDCALQDRRALETDLREALAAGNIDVMFQPQRDGDRVTGIEALACWMHPLRGSIPSAFFVPLADECGLIEELGSFVLRRALVESRRWPGLTVAVNISASQLRLNGFVAGLQAMLEESAAEPWNVELEITEGMLTANDGQLHSTLSELRRIGFRLTLANFGTGYSSLSYLGHFPINKIKIDRSFIASIPDDQVAVSIVRAIVVLAKALNLDVIAAGVDTEEQQATLAALGCTAIQGMLSGPPVAAELVAAFVTR